MGTVLDVEYSNIQNNVVIAKERQVTTTGERASFANANPVQFVKVTALVPGGVRDYRDLVNGSILYYGTVAPLGNQTNTDVYTPPVSDPVDMQPGQVARGTYKLTRSVLVSATNQTVSYTADIVRELTYQGRETFRSAVGTFNACRFTQKQVTSSSDGVVTTNIDIYVAAEGPYRGQQLKVDTSEATQMAYAPK